MYVTSFEILHFGFLVIYLSLANLLLISILQTIKGCPLYIFASLFCMYKKEHLQNKEQCFLFHFESSSRSWGNQILTIRVVKCCDVIKCLSMKNKLHFIK